MKKYIVQIAFETMGKVYYMEMYIESDDIHKACRKAREEYIPLYGCSYWYINNVWHD